MLNIQWGPSAGFYVYVSSGFYLDSDNDARAWPGGEINLYSARFQTNKPTKKAILIGITDSGTLTAHQGPVVPLDFDGPPNNQFFDLRHVVDRYNEADEDVFWVACVPIVYDDKDMSDAANRATYVTELSLGSSGPDDFALTDELVKVSTEDAQAGYLFSKLRAGDNVALSIVPDGTEEEVQIDVDLSAADDELVAVSVDDTTPGDLESKIVAGTNVSLATLNPGANEQLEITAEDKLVTITGADTTPGNFNAKVNNGNGITFGLLNPGANEIAVISVNEGEISHLNIADIGTNSHIQIDSHIASTSNPHSVTAAQAGAAADGRLKVSSDDTTEDYLENKLVAGTGITLAVLNPAGNEDVQINVADNYVFNTGDTMTGGLFINGSANEIQLLVQGNVAQDVNIFEIENSSGTNLITVGASGILSTIRQISIDGSADENQLRIQANSTQTANILEIENSAGVDILKMEASGRLLTTRQVFIDGSANEVQFRMEANATQTTHMILVEDSAGIDKLVFDSNFRLGINTNVPGDILAVNAGAIRFTTTAGGDTQYSEIEQTAGNLLKINQRNPSDSSWIDLNPIPSATGNSTIRMFNDVSSSGNPILYIYDGAGNVQHQIGNTIVWLNRQNFSACNFRVESSSANFMLYVASATNNVGINTGSPNTSSLLEIFGVGAVLLPRLTTTQRNGLTPVNGMIIYNSTNNVVEAYENGAWVNL